MPTFWGYFGVEVVLIVSVDGFVGRGGGLTGICRGRAHLKVVQGKRADS